MPTSEPRALAVRIRAVAALGLGVAAGAAAITILSRIMRSVTAVGGSCADGGPYVSAQPCPDGTGTALLLVFGCALLCVIGSLYGLSVLRAPFVLWLGWPALFLTLGWNFLEDGWFDPPAGAGAGVNGGFLFCGVLFVLMGAGPLLLALSLLEDRRRSRARQAGPPPVVVHRPHPDQPKPQPGPDPRPAARPGPEPGPQPEPVDDLPGGIDPRAAAMSVAGRLERLAALHASGELTDEEYRLAKAATLREEVSG